MSFRRLLVPLLIVFLVLTVFTMVRGRGSGTSVHHPYAGGSQSFVGQLDSGQVKSVIVSPAAQTIDVTPTSGAAYTIGYPDPELLTQQLAEHPQVAVDVKRGGSPWWISLLIWRLPLLLFIGFRIFLMNRMQGGGSKVMSFGKSRAKRVASTPPR